MLSLIYLVFGLVVSNQAENYPKRAANIDIISYGGQANEMTYCRYVETHINLNLFALIFLTIGVIYFVILIITIVNRKKLIDGLIIRIIAGWILCMGLFMYSSWNSIMCSLNQTWKPILYLYPETTTKVEVKLEREDLLLTTYPKYKNGWVVEASPDGSLKDENNKYYYALYWDQEKETPCNFEEGFYVEAKDAISFLEEKMEIIGLTERERNEFIMYWLPVLEENGKSLVQFDLTEEIEKEGKLLITPTPDSMLRVHINIKKINHKVSIKEQQLKGFERKGFTAVEWGGTIY